MLILALDTTTRAGSAAVLRDDEVLSLVPGDPLRTHAERLPGELEDALARAGVAAADVDLLAVASGPGAFTGLRIGLAAVQGLAMTLGKPVIGVSSLDALAASAANTLGQGRESGVGPPTLGNDRAELRRGLAEAAALRAAKAESRESEKHLIGCWMDAHRGEVFAALYSNSLEPVDQAGVATPQATLARWRAAGAVDEQRLVVTGDGAVRYADVLADAGIRAVAAPDLAPFIGRLALDRARAGEAGPPHALAPLYVRRPDAEIERDRRGAP